MAKWTKDTDEFKMFGTFYELTNKWYDGVSSLEEYNMAVNDINAFNKNYSKSDCRYLAKELSVALNNYIDKKYYRDKPLKAK